MKNQNKKYVIAGSLMILLLLNACTEDITLKLNNTEPRLVVDGSVSTDTMVHFVRLTVSADYYSNKEPQAISNALVTIEDDVQKIELSESDRYPGYYLTPNDYYGRVGKSYHLTIENVDIDNDGVFEIYEAESVLNSVAPIDSVRLEYEDTWDLWKVLLYAQDPVETDDFYSFSIALNDSSLTNRYSELGFVDDRFFDGNYAAGVWVQTIDEEDMELELKEGDWVKLNMNGITEEFYDYLVAVDEEVSFKAPLFSGPPSNVKGNVSNGALGFFQAYSYTTDSVQFKR
ncbi:DUF4249 domain-containing protein [Carboxylicivirga linearis]|uniref:DUF4249 domain-containing protein n=1 Tax=Carboxylicivirga linearis TaxID=1628157 RepID=A0ABS5JT46_9BACT|nr:DUF4249 domain-containing protein [Carboxylicivirga linearis]MBS2098032.1 DUF4249 domain-containing protein [Carboxylicivirga linearis]